ncbi:MAG: hypothetical protein AAFO02_21610, partial [Bacteroidota bacterium]
YDYLNNLYSSGQPLLTNFQLDIVFNEKSETQWNKNWRFFAYGKATISRTTGSNALFDGFSLQDFTFSSGYTTIMDIRLSNEGLSGRYDFGFFKKGFRNSFPSRLGKRRNSEYLESIHDILTDDN